MTAKAVHKVSGSTGYVNTVRAAFLVAPDPQDEGKKLLEKSFQESADTGMSASPTWLTNNKFKFSGIDAEKIKTEVCAHNKLAGCDVTLSSVAPY